MPHHTVLHVIFLIFTGTAILSTIALYTRQSLLVAYILLGALCGPWGLKLIYDSHVIDQAGNIGIIFLLFLLGLDLQPQRLWYSLRKMTSITLISSFFFLVLGFGIGYSFHYTFIESLFIGITMMFSSTIIGIKLLPTTVLHHQHTGELMISILLLQDLIAIFVLFAIQAMSNIISPDHVIIIIGALPLLLLTATFFQRFILSKLLTHFDQIHEYVFILSVGWCLFMAELAHVIGLSPEIGAFIAGIALATSPVSFYIAESLKPLRDFFLVIFFFAIGAGFNFEYFHEVIIGATLLALLILILKPFVFQRLLQKTGEAKATAREVGIRLGQASEFSLLVVYLAIGTHLISAKTSYMVQAATLLTFIVSSYWVVLRYPTPIAASDRLRRD